MTPEQLTGLALLLMDLRDWLDAQDPDTLDRAIIDRAIDVCADARNRLVMGGAQ